MPTYAYACTKCGHQFDVVQSFSEESLTTCPECAGPLRKQYNAVGVVFKGGGFYRTDSRSGSGDSGGKEGSSSSTAPSGDSNGSATSSDSKGSATSGDSSTGSSTAASSSTTD